MKCSIVGHISPVQFIKYVRDLEADNKRLQAVVDRFTVKCPQCQGAGWYPVEVTATGFAHDPNDPAGEPIAVPVAKQEQELCENCWGVGVIAREAAEVAKAQGDDAR